MITTDQSSNAQNFYTFSADIWHYQDRIVFPDRTWSYTDNNNLLISVKGHRSSLGTSSCTLHRDKLNEQVPLEVLIALPVDRIMQHT